MTKKMNKQYESELEQRIETLTNKIVKYEEKIDYICSKKSVYRFRGFVRKPTDNLSYYLFEQIFYNEPSADDLKRFKNDYTTHTSIIALAQSFFGVASGIEVSSVMTDVWEEYVDILMSVKENLQKKNLKVFEHTEPKQTESHVFDLGFCLSEVDCADKLII